MLCAMPEKAPISANCCSQCDYSAGITIGPALDVPCLSVSGCIYCKGYIYLYTYMKHIA